MRKYFTEDCTHFTDFRLMLVIIQTPGGGGGAWDWWPAAY